MIKRIFKDFYQSIYNCYHYIYIYCNEIKKLRMRKDLWKNISLSEEQEKEIQSVFGKKIGCKWHRLYQSYTKRYNKNYFPEILFSTKLEPILCPKNICDVLQDKSMLEILYKSVPKLRLPRTVVVNCSDIFYDGNRNVINKDIAVLFVEQWCRNKNFVIKPILETHSGKNVSVWKQDPNCTEEEIRKLFDLYKKNFIIQEQIVNSDELGTLYDKSVNTIRVMTYILDDRMYHTPLIMRMGQSGNEVDNVGAGGMFIGVSNEGYLNEAAYTKKGGVYLIHPDSKIQFKGYHIPNIPKVIECAYACHKRTPHTRFVSWDFTLDENNEPVLIEANMLGHSTYFPQAASGMAVFGDNTKRMLELIGNR